MKSNLKIVPSKFKSPWYNLRPLLGHASWGCMFYIILASRMTGKGFCVQDYCLSEWKKNPNNIMYWIRLREEQAKQLLKNNAENLIEPILLRRYDLHLETSGQNVYDVKYEEITTKQGKTKKKLVSKVLLGKVMGASTFYKTKGQTQFDAEFLKGEGNKYNVIVDEFIAEAQESNFDRSYALINLLETLFRNTKEKIKIFMLGNDVTDASDILTCFNFIPEKWGIYKLKSKKAVIDYVKPSAEYEEMRRGSIADILMGTNSTFSNKRDNDYSLIDKRPLIAPNYVIKFSKEPEHWYTVWNNNIVTAFNKEKKHVVAMRPYLDELFSADAQKAIIQTFDTRCYHFRNLITFKKFQQDLQLLKPRQS